MIYIDDFNRDENMNFEFAVNLIENYRSAEKRPLLDAMIEMRDFLNDLEYEYESLDAIDEFYENWHYEINAFNTVFKNMSKLFH